MQESLSYTVGCLQHHHYAPAKEATDASQLFRLRPLSRGQR